MTGEEKRALAEATGLSEKQVQGWFITKRKTVWKPAVGKSGKGRATPGMNCDCLWLTSLSPCSSQTVPRVMKMLVNPRERLGM